MKARLDIVTGFIGSGKTTFINQVLSVLPVQDRVVVVLGETGEAEIEQFGPEVEVVEIGDKSSVAQVLSEVWSKHRPVRVILEYNCLLPLEETLVDVEDELGQAYSLGSIVHVADATSFDVITRNIGGPVIEHISHSNVIVVNRSESVSPVAIAGLKAKIKTVSPRAAVILGGTQQSAELAMQSKQKKRSLGTSVSMFTALFFGVLAALALSQWLFEPGALKQLGIFNTIFLGILVEALPFIMIGLLASSILQVLIPSEALLRAFPRNTYLGILVASLAGLVFPVCDCAVIPVAGRLIRKGVPVPAAVTFMMASPIIDPVVIMATLYAFPGNPIIALYRVVLGLCVAITIGVVFSLTYKKQGIMLDTLATASCACGFCGQDTPLSQGLAGRIRGVFRHVETEFFGIIRFVIIGAAISGVIHTFVPQPFLAGIGSNRATSLIVMMMLAYVMSMCSTSDAFVGKSFMGPFGLTPVMGFLIFGPMMDLKNTLIMLGMFERRFVLRLIILTFIACFTAVYFLTPLLF